MDRIDKIVLLREKLRAAGTSIGSWMQIPDGSIAEVMGQAGYDWVAVDLEHGSISSHQLPGLFRALELGGTLPLVRLARGHFKDCKAALDAGAGGVIIPMIESAEQLEALISVCRWPPSGTRGVGFSRANLFGKHFDRYATEAQQPFVVAQIEHINAVKNLEKILAVPGLDAVLVGPYDLSASMGITARFDDPQFRSVMSEIQKVADNMGIPAGLHVVDPSIEALNSAVASGARFIAYSIDAVFLRLSCAAPVLEPGK